MALCKFLAFLFADCAIRQISLVGTEHFDYIGTGVSFDLLQPVLNIVVGTLFCAVVSKNDSHSSLVVSLSDRAESFLTGSIPDLELYSLAFDLDSLDLEVNAYSWHVGQWNISLGEPEQNATFADVGISNDN